VSGAATSWRLAALLQRNVRKSNQETKKRLSGNKKKYKFKVNGKVKAFCIVLKS
jgi:hypothetical protein